MLEVLNKKLTFRILLWFFTGVVNFEPMKYKSFFLLFILSLLFGCNEGGGNITVKLPNSFRGYGALIFEEDDNCQETNRDMVVFPNKQGFVVVPNKRCMIMNNVDMRYKYEMVDTTGKYQQICPISYLGGCHTSNCDTYNNLYLTGCSTLGMNSKEIVVFYIGDCVGTDSALYLNSPESRRFQEMLDSVTSKMN
tara:strand:+ start:855 stop:1436 length:582 start_codon:yes stop_codon:yes gene_type:complete